MEVVEDGFQGLAETFVAKAQRPRCSVITSRLWLESNFEARPCMVVGAVLTF